MKLLPLLGKRIKDDDMIELLEDLDAVVTYDFDRLHENMPDVYWAACRRAGLQLQFDENQILKTIFIYVQPDGDIDRVDISRIEDIQFFNSVDAVEQSRGGAAAKFLKGKPDQKSFDGRPMAWIRQEGPPFWIHHEFISGNLSRVTIMSAEV